MELKLKKQNERIQKTENEKNQIIEDKKKL